jgi:Cu-Zn family superoxide dismutase
MLAAAGLVAVSGTSQAHEITAHAVLRGADGAALGSVRFEVAGSKTRVRAHLRLPAPAAWDAFHGFHIHANADPANGTGCVADPKQPSSTWFVSADGHLTQVGAGHGAHKGDLPSILVNADGTGDIQFTTGRLEVKDLKNRAVIVHAGPDNFGNIPVGALPEQYQPNSAAATARTAATGNAGDRLACGLVTIKR